MKQGKRLPPPALVVAAMALFVALGGTVYAAKKAKLDGRAIRVKSIPGNRVKPHSIAANRLKADVLAGLEGHTGKIIGAEIDLQSLGQVPSAAHAETADRAQSATDAETAQNAVNAINATNVNGHTAGCLPGTKQFAGACWQLSPSETPLSAPAAASSCAAQGGTLPEALELAAFAQEPGVNLDKGDEWSSDIPVVSSPGLYGVVTVSASAEVFFTSSTNTRKFRCVIPLVT
ncbi:MAG TPA: hypothetical protein VF245_03015 [Solirubrobacterales bacterium]